MQAFIFLLPLDFFFFFFFLNFELFFFLIFRLSLLYFRIYFLHTDIIFLVTVSYDILAIACLNLLCVCQNVCVFMYIYICMNV